MGQLVGSCRAGFHSRIGSERISPAGAFLRQWISVIIQTQENRVIENAGIELDRFYFVEQGLGSRVYERGRLIGGHGQVTLGESGLIEKIVGKEADRRQNGDEGESGSFLDYGVHGFLALN
jgi:hypothetical protein